MPVPQVVIVGRPNVGKSSVFNWLARRRIAIVDPTSGVTRDRVTTLVADEDVYFELVDTGGMGVEDRDDLTDDIEHQIRSAIDEADVIVFVVDAIAGITPMDEQVARRLRLVDKPVVTVANKCDNPRLIEGAAEFYRLGRSRLVTTSVAHRTGYDELFEAITACLPETPADERPADPELKLAIVGRRNVGKSTFINFLAQSQRMIVSAVPGTTRDSVDVHFEKDGKPFVAIDTAGMRRAKGLSDSVEFYSMARSQRSIRRADVVFLFIDPTQAIGRLDQQLGAYVHDQFKPCVFVINKWDLLHPQSTAPYVDLVHGRFPMMRHAPIAFITAKTGKNVQSLLDLGQSLAKQGHERVGTGVLNRVIQGALERRTPPASRGKIPKIYYATQVATAPPTIVAFCNRPRSFPPHYQRYLLRELRSALAFKEIPIKLYLRSRIEADVDDAPS